MGMLIIDAMSRNWIKKIGKKKLIIIIIIIFKIFYLFFSSPLALECKHS
jgi:hypothetical protein